MNKIVYLFIIAVIVMMSSCGIFARISQISINKLEKDQVLFISLPAEIKEFFYNRKTLPPKGPWELSLTDFFAFNTACEYEFKSVETLIGPWISHYLLIDKTNKITYKIGYEHPTPIFIYDREIFIPTDYNVLSKKQEKFEALKFSRYLLDGKARR
jgi:hypothetical protein